MIDVVVLNYNDWSTVERFINSIYSYSYIERIVVVDNHSTDNSFIELKKKENSKIVVLKTEKNGGYGYGNNFGIKYLSENASNNNVLVCNPDVEICEDVLIRMDEFLKQNQEYAVVAPYSLDKNGNKAKISAFKVKSDLKYILSFSSTLNSFFHFCEYNDFSTLQDDYADVDAVVGSLYLCNLNKMIKYGMYDENIFLYCEERLLGLKLAKNGQKTALLHRLTYIHNHSESINKTLAKENDRFKILYNSRFYLLKNYYKSSRFKMILAYILTYSDYCKRNIVFQIKKQIKAARMRIKRY